MTTKLWYAGATISVALSLGVLSGVSALKANRQEQAGPASVAPKDAFDEADLGFISAYAGARAVTLSRLDPIIVVELDSLVFVHHGKRSEVRVIPPLYHRLKAVSHLPLAIYVSLGPYGNAPLDDDRLSTLRSLRSRLATTLQSLEKSGMNAQQQERSVSMLTRCATFLDGVLRARRYEVAALSTLTRSCGPVVLAHAGDAARAQIDAYHKQVLPWYRDLAPEERSKVRVLVLGRQMPRKHNVAVQYFAKLLGETGESRRLVYAEELMGEQQGLNLLATHQLDSELSEAFFENPDRMEIDLLGNAASVYVDSIDFSR